MVVLTLVRDGIKRMLKKAGTSMKCILMDQETLQIVNMSFTKDEMVFEKVILFDLIQNKLQNHKLISDLTCVCILKSSSIIDVCEELTYPRFKNYFLYFTQPLQKSDIKKLAESDQKSLVKLLEVVYIDFIPISDNVFLSSSQLNQCVRSIISMLVSMEKCPFIRFQNTSEKCQVLANRISSAFRHEADKLMFDMNHSACLLILDRREDPITPILNQWTYQSLIHEQFEIKGNVVQFKDSSCFVLSNNDKFYRENKYENYGSVSIKLANMIRQLYNQQPKAKFGKKLETIADIKEFIEKYPSFTKTSKMLSDHVKLLNELSENISTLMKISKLEQLIVTNSSSMTELMKAIVEIIEDVDNVKDLDCVRLVALFVLRFERSLKEMKSKLLEIRKNLDARLITFIDNILNYGGSKFRKFNLFRQYSKNSNALCQHQPLITLLLEKLLKGKLEETTYPYLNSIKPTTSDRIKDLTVFVVGGLTYGEICSIYTSDFVKSCRIVLGSSGMYNFNQFIDEVLNYADEM